MSGQNAVSSRGEIAGLILLFLSVAPVAQALSPGELARLAWVRIDIDGIGFEALARLESSAELLGWVEADDELLALTATEDLEALARRWRVERLDVPVAPEHVLFVREAHRRDIEDLGPDVDLLVHGGRTAVVQVRPGHPGLPESMVSEDPVIEDRDRGARIVPFVPDTILARQRANTRRWHDGPLEPEVAVQDLVDQVDPARWFVTVSALAEYNRYTHGNGIGFARDWLWRQFSLLSGLEVTTESFQVGGTTAYNVIATWTGTSRPDDWYIVGGHYDATSENPSVAAPGAEDNASGCAGVLEMARVMSDHAPETTVIYICYSGEEQGLWGSAAHAGGLVASGDDEKVRAMLNMDMIGYTGDPDLDCLIETHPDFAGLLETFGNAAERYTSLRIVTSLNPFGSDHVPYINRGMAALLTIENDWSSYPHYHRTTDLPEHLSLDMGGEILRMNIAVLADFLGVADGDRIFADGFESGDTSAWMQ